MGYAKLTSKHVSSESNIFITKIPLPQLPAVTRCYQIKLVLEKLFKKHQNLLIYV